MSKCLVTGGAGFVGSHLVDKLIEEGYEVVVVDNLSTGKREYLNPRAKFYEVDFSSDGIDVVFQLEKFDYVFHLGAQPDVGLSVSDPMHDNRVNVHGTYRVFKHSADQGVKKIIFVSTGGAIMGECPEALTEDDMIDPVSPYAIHKYAAERYLEYYRDLKNIDYVIFRPSNIYGPRQHKGGETGVIGVFTYNAVHKKPSIIYGDGSKTRDWVYVSDVVDALIKAKDYKHREIFNLSTAREISILDLVEAIEKHTGEKFEYTHKENRPGEVSKSVLSNRKIKNHLGWEPKVSFEEGVAKTLEWVKKQKDE